MMRMNDVGSQFRDKLAEGLRKIRIRISELEIIEFGPRVVEIVIRPVGLRQRRAQAEFTFDASAAEEPRLGRAVLKRLE